jgi:hypothetical protein
LWLRAAVAGEATSAAAPAVAASTAMAYRARKALPRPGIDALNRRRRRILK